MKRIITLTIWSFLMVGCATPYSQFYYDQTGGVDITTNTIVILSKDEPQIFRGNIDNQEEETLQMFEDGYSLVGYSSFNAGNVNEKQAITQAKNVHASVVITYSKYTGTVSGILPLTLPTTQTSNTTLSGNVYGSGESAIYSGTARTTTYGSRTTYIPYSVNRNDYLATYWIKTKPLTFGVYIRDLPTEMRLELQSNKGVLVIAVVKGSPAFQADILRGDVIRKIGDIEMYDGETCKKTISGYAGQKVNVVILREGKEIVKEIQFNKES